VPSIHFSVIFYIDRLKVKRKFEISNFALYIYELFSQYMLLINLLMISTAHW